MATDPQPWAVDHQLHVLYQTESRPEPPNTDGDQWMERRRTGKAMAVCPCGYTSGLVDTPALPDPAALTAAHPDVYTPPPPA